jgi:mannitol/fructose-specific phosphotransferase system IIA component (Ntr-type)
MTISSILRAEHIILIPQVTDKAELIRSMVQSIPNFDQEYRNSIIQAVLDRESIMSTGVGGGIAIPHAKIEGFEQTMMIVVKLDEPVEYQSPDGKAVDIAFLVLGSTSNSSSHLKVLSALSRMLINKDVITSLRNASSPESIMEVILHYDRLIA